MFNQNYRVLLAGPSLLYAPLYLAKVEQLSYAFKWIAFDYPSYKDTKRQDLLGKDPLLYKLLEKEYDRDVVMSVGDPFRLRYPKSIGHDVSDAVVIGGLIQSMCLWLIAADRINGDLCNMKISESFNQVVVHRPEMTSFALVANLLLGENLSPSDVRSILFQNARIGEEHLWAIKRPRYRNGKNQLPNAYITGDRDHASEAHSNNYPKRSFYTEQKFRNMFFSGLITSKSIQEKHGALLEELTVGIVKAIEIINNDHKWAAGCLLKSVDLMQVMHTSNSETWLIEYLKGLVDQKAYVCDRNLKMSLQSYQESHALHINADKVRSDGSQQVSLDEGLRAAFLCIDNGGESRTHSSTSSISYGFSGTRDRIIPNPILMHLGVLAAWLSLIIVIGYKTVHAADELTLISGLLKQLSTWHTYSVHIEWFLRSQDRTDAILLAFMALILLSPSMNDLLNGIYSSQPWKTFYIWCSATVGIIALVWTLSDWNTMIGALCSWATVSLAVLQYIRRYVHGRMSLRESSQRLKTIFILQVLRLCHCCVELREKKNRDKPIEFSWKNIQLLWRR